MKVVKAENQVLHAVHQRPENNTNTKSPIFLGVFKENHQSGHKNHQKNKIVDKPMGIAQWLGQLVMLKHPLGDIKPGFFQQMKRGINEYNHQGEILERELVKVCFHIFQQS